MRQDRSAGTVAALLAALGISFLYVLVMGLLQVAMPQWPRTGLVLAQVATLLVPALVARRGLTLLGLLPPERPRPPARTWLAPVTGLALSGALVAWAIAVPWLALLDAVFGSALDGLKAETAQAYAAIFSAGSVAEAVLVVVLLGVMPATCEEPVFRGLFQRGLALSAPPAVAIGLSALYFSLAHLEPFGFPSRLFLGASLGLVYARTGSLLACGALHGINNALSVSIVYLDGLRVDPALMFDDPLARTVGGGSSLAFWLLAAVATAAWVASWRALARATPPPAPPPLPPPGPSAEPAS